MRPGFQSGSFDNSRVVGFGYGVGQVDSHEQMGEGGRLVVGTDQLEGTRPPVLPLVFQTSGTDMESLHGIKLQIVIDKYIQTGIDFPFYSAAKHSPIAPKIQTTGDEATFARASKGGSERRIWFEKFVEPERSCSKERL